MRGPFSAEVFAVKIWKLKGIAICVLRLADSRTELFPAICVLRLADSRTELFPAICVLRLADSRTELFSGSVSESSPKIESSNCWPQG